MIDYCQEGLRIARDVGYRRAEAVCYIYLGHAYRGLGDLTTARENLRLGLKLAHKLQA